jgi:hypothetical protein
MEKPNAARDEDKERRTRDDSKGFDIRQNSLIFF